MLFTSMPFAMAAIWLSLLLLTGVHAQSTTPSNDTSSVQNDVGFLMSTTLHNMASTIKVVPLSSQAGLAGTTDQLQAINPVGSLFMTSAGNVNQLPVGAIAYISCEPSDYSGPIDAARTISLAANTKPVAIVLYSRFSSACGFATTSSFQFTSLYTTEDANSSTAVFTGLMAASPPNPNTSIHVDMSTINGTSSSGGGILGRSPTTAVAMIILYSITGIITALFLIIIVVGAIRAHRHPERYGPRRVMGRQRQSRAKGIARAMLETLPIVKFGDLEEENKPPEPRTDIELGSTPVKQVESETNTTQTPNDHAEGSHTEPSDTPDPVDPTSTEAVAAEAGSITREQTIETGTPAIDNGLACSVCVEDFEKGQDVRVLPCKHRFHPECIDPWLLNVSGTCPLCRTDLRPTHSHGDEQEDAPAPPSTTSLEDASNTAAFNETTRRNRRSRILSTLNIGRMRNATPEERLAALRMLRNEQRTGDSTPRTRNRFSQRLSRTFGSRPHSGAATPRRNSGPPVTSESSPTIDTHPTTEMESTTEEEPSAVAASAGGLSPTVEEPSSEGAAHVEEAHEAVAPQTAGAAHTVEAPRSPVDATREGSHPSTKAADKNATAVADIETSPKAEIAADSEAPQAGSSKLSDAENTKSESPQTPKANSVTPSTSTAAVSPSEPNIAPFYSYR